MDINPVDILIHIINILVLFVLLRLLIYKPVKKFMDERSQRIQKEMDHASEISAQAEELHAQYQADLADADTTAQQVVREAAQKANETAQEILRDAKAQAGQMVEDARVKAEAERARALSDMEDQIADLAVDMAGHILQREVKLEDNKAVVKDFFQKVG